MWYVRHVRKDVYLLVNLLLLLLLLLVLDEGKQEEEEECLNLCFVRRMED
jgi:hypothetical protein